MSDLNAGEAQKCVCQGVGSRQVKRPMAGHCDKLKEAECGELWESQGKEGPEPERHSQLPIGNRMDRVARQVWGRGRGEESQRV